MNRLIYLYIAMILVLFSCSEDRRVNEKMSDIYIEEVDSIKPKLETVGWWAYISKYDACLNMRIQLSKGEPLYTAIIYFQDNSSIFEVLTKIDDKFIVNGSRDGSYYKMEEGNLIKYDREGKIPGYTVKRLE